MSPICRETLRRFHAPAPHNGNDEAFPSQKENKAR